MTKITHAISRVMMNHDHEAPTAAELLGALAELADSEAPTGQRTRLTHRWRRPLVAAAAAAAVATIALATAWASGLTGPVQNSPVTSSTAPLACPVKHAGGTLWVPAKPTGFDGRSRLAPQQVPASVVICAYSGNSRGPQRGWGLSGRRILSGGLAQVAGLLAWQPRFATKQPLGCVSPSGKQTDYLVGLAYGDGTKLWVTAQRKPSFCAGSSNGQFHSVNDLGPVVARAFASGQWPAQSPPSCSPTYLAGRLGQSATMVPAGADSVLICVGNNTHAATTKIQALVSALNSLPTRAATGVMDCGNGPPPGGSYYLNFIYPQGPPATVTVLPPCRPAISSYGLQSASAKTVLPIIRQILRSDGSG